ncbi:alpha-glucoside-specific PTS transporter subunit IIBC [Enterococcus hulanensis]|uniref:alpha-glucoside-specific PTS transporter subunit IIBC n=1 Tax=Enterococcus hulanensis TaxID=2559929 RepID=UPI00288F1C0F|nr:alpha-glucoside-specific PTS transporter subunit IIBC [Enterococcus hulanensis]MDT2662569.1 alpha-glucoside-specific PTS transporter subunit IIBC [Enterococcus hulanensis]
MMDKQKIKQSIQRFGGAMFTPVLFFAVFGIIVGITAMLKNPLVVGEIANADTTWFKVMDVINVGANAVFKQMPLLFCIGLPVALVKKQSARASLEAFVIYVIFMYFVSTILMYWGPTFGIDFLSEDRTSGLATIAGIKTLDMGIVGALLISGISVYLHNKFFDKELPKYIETFRGSPLVVLIGFVAMLPVAILACIIWPQVQHGIANVQTFLIGSGGVGIWLYTFLERLLIPTGLHHFIYAPFLYDNAVVAGGIKAYWVEHLTEFSTIHDSLRNIFPQGGFALTGMGKMFAPLGISMALYKTALPEKRKKILSILIPVLITAVFTGITEPLEFTFLFVAPVLFLVHAFLSATMAAITFAFGITGDFSLGLIQNATLNWIPLWPTQWQSYLIQIVIGIVFVGIYYVSFKFIIEKMNLKTPGRELTEETKLYSKDEYRAQKGKETAANPHEILAKNVLVGLGGAENIVDVTNCATRLRVSVIDPKLLKAREYFSEIGTHGLVVNDKAIQVIIGLTVPSVREEFEKII